MALISSSWRDLRPDSFRLFGADHLAALGLLVVLSACVIRYGRRWDSRARNWIAWCLAGLIAAYTAVIYVRYGRAGVLSPDWALPLELCHCVLIASVVGLVAARPLAMEIAYFWGLGGTLQAVLTPEITEGFPSVEFLLFFWSHGVVLLAIAFFIACRGFRPRAGSIARMMLYINLYAITVGGLNAAFGWNYGYLCRKPTQPSLLDWLGPWPWYLLALEGVALASFWLFDLPWRPSRRRHDEGQK